MKYIMFEDFSGHAVPILFPDRVRHEEMREAIPYTRVLSAGYVALGPKGITCHGAAPELESAVGPEDAAIISGHIEG